MPQLDISTYFTQIFWVISTFLVLWFIMDRFIVSKIADTIEARKRKYDSSVFKAEETNKKALASLKRYEETLAAAKTEANEKINQNEEELKAEISQKEIEITQRVKQEIEDSEKTLASEKADTMLKIEELAENAAYKVAQQLGLESITLKDIQDISEKKGA